VNLPAASRAGIDFFIDACPFAIIEWSRDLRILRWSPEAERVFGWSAAEVLGKRPDEWRFTHPDDEDGVKRAIGQAITRSTPPPPVVGRNYTRDGRLLHCEWHNRANRDADGRLVSLLSFAKDLTLQFRAERALDVSEARYAAIFRNSHAVMLIMDPESLEIVDANPAAEAFYGWPLASLQRMRISDINIFPPERIRAEMQAARAAARFHFDFRHRRADGSIRDVEVYSGPIVHESRTLLFSIVHDVSARKEAEATLRKLSSAVEESPESIVITNLAGDIEYVNESFLRKSRYQPEEVLGRNPRILQSGKTPRSTYEEMWRTLTAGKAWTGVLHNRNKDGEEYYERAHIVPIHDAGGKPTHYVAIKEDITAARRMEAELRDYRERLEHLVDTRTRELSEALAAAEAANRAKSDFLATMSHEIRTPMNGVTGLVDVLAHSGLDEEQSEMVDIMRDSAATLLHPFDDILDFSKIESGHLELDLHPADLVELVERVGDTLQPVAKKRGVTLEVFVDPDLPPRVLTDGLRVQQILTNLAGNAIKFSSGEGRSGRVDLRAARSADGRLALSVRDDGIGMSAEVVRRLFQPFSQAETSTTRRFGGTGLGLAISRRLADLLGGEITVESSPGAGACFTLALPLEAACADEHPQAQALAGVLCILAIADSRLVADWGSYLAHAGARVKRAPSIEHALHFLAAATQEAVLLTDRALAPGAQARWQKIPAPQRPGVLLIVHGARRQAREQAPGLYTLDREGVHRDELIRAVAAACVRAPAASASGPTLRHGAAAVAGLDTLRAAARILVAEDNHINRKVISRQLGLLGLSCDMAEDGEQALARWREVPYDLLLTDLHMPNMDGYTLAARIRAEEVPGQRLAIIAVSANALRGEDRRCLDAGMDDYLVKPVQIEALRAVLERHLPAATRAAPAATDPTPEAEAEAEASAPASAAPAVRTAEPVLDTRVLARLIGDDPKLIAEFVREYHDSARAAGEEILHAVRAGDWPATAGVAHRLKSASRSVGALQLGELCAELEDHCRKGGPPRPAEMVARFAAALRAALEASAAAGMEGNSS